MLVRLTRRAHAIPGLYAVGGDMHHIMGGVDPAPGIHLGPALVFARLAALHASAHARQATSVTSTADSASEAMQAAVQAAMHGVALDPSAKINASTSAVH
jgi:succinate dehydrogenase/fumarate reductase flavoprotein subunit